MIKGMITEYQTLSDLNKEEAEALMKGIWENWRRRNKLLSDSKNHKGWESWEGRVWSGGVKSKPKHSQTPYMEWSLIREDHYGWVFLVEKHVRKFGTTLSSGQIHKAFADNFEANAVKFVNKVEDLLREKRTRFSDHPPKIEPIPFPRPPYDGPSVEIGHVVKLRDDLNLDPEALRGYRLEDLPPRSIVYDTEFKDTFQRLEVCLLNKHYRVYGRFLEILKDGEKVNPYYMMSVEKANSGGNCAVDKNVAINENQEGDNKQFVLRAGIKTELSTDLIGTYDEWMEVKQILENPPKSYTKFEIAPTLHLTISFDEDGDDDAYHYTFLNDRDCPGYSGSFYVNERQSKFLLDEFSSWGRPLLSS